jgi:ribosomal protein S18 acetylase RimI-like enzyme
MEGNLRVALAGFTLAKPGETCELPGLAIANSCVPFSMFNSTVLTAPAATAEELGERVRAAASFFGSAGLPWSFWLCQDWIARDALHDVDRVFRKSGLHLVVELPGMLAERVLPPRRVLPPLEFRRVGDTATRIDFNHIMSVAFGIPIATSREIYEQEATWRGSMVGWIGYAEGVPITTAATVTAAGVVGLYAVGTLPGWQGKGFGEAVVRHALAEARAQSGIEETVLQSSQAGFRLYQRMGYHTVTRYAVFAYS